MSKLALTHSLAAFGKCGTSSEFSYTNPAIWDCSCTSGVVAWVEFGRLKRNFLLLLSLYSFSQWYDLLCTLCCTYWFAVGHFFEEAGEGTSCLTAASTPAKTGRSLRRSPARSLQIILCSQWVFVVPELQPPGLQPWSLITVKTCCPHLILSLPWFIFPSPDKHSFSLLCPHKCHSWWCLKF